MLMRQLGCPKVHRLTRSWLCGLVGCLMLVIQPVTVEAQDPRVRAVAEITRRLIQVGGQILAGYGVGELIDQARGRDFVGEIEELERRLLDEIRSDPDPEQLRQLAALREEVASLSAAVEANDMETFARRVANLGVTTAELGEVVVANTRAIDAVRTDTQTRISELQAAGEREVAELQEQLNELTALVGRLLASQERRQVNNWLGPAPRWRVTVSGLLHRGREESVDDVDFAYEEWDTAVRGEGISIGITFPTHDWLFMGKVSRESVSSDAERSHFRIQADMTRSEAEALFLRHFGQLTIGATGAIANVSPERLFLDGRLTSGANAVTRTANRVGPVLGWNGGACQIAGAALFARIIAQSEVIALDDTGWSIHPSMITFCTTRWLRTHGVTWYDEGPHFRLSAGAAVPLAGPFELSGELRGEYGKRSYGGNWRGTNVGVGLQLGIGLAKW